MSVKTGFVLKGIAGVSGMFLLVGGIVMYLWNWLMPELFSLANINYLQALGLLLLSKIFFGAGGSHFAARWKGAWAEHMKAKMDSMTPEERERFRQQWEARCGKWRKETNS